MTQVLFCRREKFEQTLNEYQAEVDVYQEKEVPRHLEDIKKVVEQLEKLSENLEQSKQEAMVSQRHVCTCSYLDTSPLL